MNLDGGVHRIPLEGVPGELWLCGKHAIAPDPTALFDRIGRQDRATHVVCLVERHELAGRYLDYVRWLGSSADATWHPIHDLSSPDLDDVLPLYADVWRRVRGGQVVVAHCAAGIGRAGTLAVAVCLLAGLPLDDAVAHVRRHRPGAGPEVGPQRVVVEELAARLAASDDAASG